MSAEYWQWLNDKKARQLEEKARRRQARRCHQQSPVPSPSPSPVPSPSPELSSEPSHMTDMTEESQTYPSSHLRIVRQSSDLTCGMRCLQNLLGSDVVTRTEMDTKSRALESIASGEQLYDPTLGYYSIEVLQGILADKGKHVQRVDIQKLEASYFEPVIAMNPDFVGYIVALGVGLKHYVAIRYSAGTYTIIDSLGSTMPVSLDALSLFQRRHDQQVYCSQHAADMKPVVAVLAVAESPFVEYTIMHDTWSLPPPPARFLLSSIKRLLQPPYLKSTVRKIGRAAPVVREWWEHFKQRRQSPHEDCLPFLKQLVSSKPTYSILVTMNELQTVIECSELADFLHELRKMGWISDKSDFMFEQDGNMIYECETEGSFEECGIHVHRDDPNNSIRIVQNGATQASVGGFYKLYCSIAGECIDNKYNAYSVRDGNGVVHVIYKQTVESVEKM